MNKSVKRCAAAAIGRRLVRFFGAFGLVGLVGLVAFASQAGQASAAERISHAGPMLKIEVQRGSESLPLNQVDHLRKGDLLRVSAEPHRLTDGAWVMVLATIGPPDNQVMVQRFDLTDTNAPPAIAITDDQQVPVIVVAPQIKSFFGLGTSFGQSANLIEEALAAEPERILELQKIDQLDKAISTLTAGLTSLVAGLKPSDAVVASKNLAAKFGAKTIDPTCISGDNVDARCVAISIVSSQDLKIPSLTEMGSIAQPLVSNALSPDTIENIRLVAAASSFLSKKFRDHYELAPSSAQRDKESGRLTLFANAEFKNGEIKTAYIYVPSWYFGPRPTLSPGGPLPACLSTGQFRLNVSGQLPMGNFWHDWALRLAPNSGGSVAIQAEQSGISPEGLQLALRPSTQAWDWNPDGRLFQVSLGGRYAFEALPTLEFAAALPYSGKLAQKVSGLDSLVSGDLASLQMADPGVYGCIDQLQIVYPDTPPLPALKAPGEGHWNIDLQNQPAGPATLRITQFGGPDLSMPVEIQPARARISKLEHFDLEPALFAKGSNLARISHLQIGADKCLPADDPLNQADESLRKFSCPESWSLNSSLPETAGVHYLNQQPRADQVPIQRVGMRPQVVIGNGKNALVPVLSPNAYRWGIGLNDPLLTQASGLSMQLTPVRGYKLARGSYTLQLKFVDDPVTEQSPINAYLMADIGRNELRTRHALDFSTAVFPNVVNPAAFRVLHQPSGLASDWQMLPKSLVSLPKFSKVECDTGGHGLLIHGSQLDLIDWASNDPEADSTEASHAEDPARFAKLTPCEDGLCLGIRSLGPEDRLKIKVQWIDNRIFDVRFPNAPRCN